MRVAGHPSLYHGPGHLPFRPSHWCYLVTRDPAHTQYPYPLTYPKVPIIFFVTSSRGNRQYNANAGRFRLFVTSSLSTGRDSVVNTAQTNVIFEQNLDCRRPTFWIYYLTFTLLSTLMHTLVCQSNQLPVCQLKRKEPSSRVRRIKWPIAHDRTKRRPAQDQALFCEWSVKHSGSEIQRAGNPDTTTDRAEPSANVRLSAFLRRKTGSQAASTKDYNANIIKFVIAVCHKCALPAS